MGLGYAKPPLVSKTDETVLITYVQYMIKRDYSIMAVSCIALICTVRHIGLLAMKLHSTENMIQQKIRKTEKVH